MTIWPPHHARGAQALTRPGWIGRLKMGAALVFGAWCLVLFQSAAFAQTTAFTYQGRLNNNGAPANGFYDWQFAVLDASAGGSQIGSALTTNAVAVSNGLFIMTLDFGAGVFTGADRWLFLSVKTNGAVSFTPLTPPQKITAAPYALHAAYAGDIEPGASVSFSGGSVSFHTPTPFYLGPSATNTVLGLSAQYLAGMHAGRFWWLGGNSGQLPGDYVLGTLDDNPLEFKVNGQPALRIDPAPDGPNMVGGLAGFRPTVIAGGVRGGGGGGRRRARRAGHRLWCGRFPCHL